MFARDVPQMSGRRGEDGQGTGNDIDRQRERADGVAVGVRGDARRREAHRADLVHLHLGDGAMGTAVDPRQQPEKAESPSTWRTIPSRAGSWASSWKVWRRWTSW